MINAELGADLVLHILILFTFLSILYITFISKTSKQSFEKEISHAIDGATKNLMKNEDVKKYASMLPYDTLIARYNDQSKYIEVHNSWLFGTLKYGLVTTWIMLCLFIYLLKSKCGEEIDVISLIKNNVATFALIGVVEYMFFTNVALKFIPIAPSTLTITFLDELKKNF